MNDEYIDILDKQGNYTGKTCLKSEAHTHGYFHPTVHVWLYTDDRKILLQKRAPTKKVFPNLWDISVAGHIAAGEAITKAAIREVEEEIGFHITANELTKIGIRKHIISHPNGIIDNEFHHVFIGKLTIPIEKLVIQESELTEIKLFDLGILKNVKKYDNILIPTYQEYYDFVYNCIMNTLE